MNYTTAKRLKVGQKLLFINDSFDGSTYIEGHYYEIYKLIERTGEDFMEIWTINRHGEEGGWWSSNEFERFFKLPAVNEDELNERYNI